MACVVPQIRPVDQLRRGDFAVHCPICGEATTSIPTPESTPGGGETVYALTKVDQERLVLLWGKQTGIPTVALRYSCTYGPRQSLFNPYTGVIAIFCTRLLNNQPPILYEDGNQTRDLCFVEDIARANLLAAESDKLDGLPVNVGSGRATTVRDLARIIANQLNIRIEPLARGEFRPGEIRSLISDITRARTIGYEPCVTIEQGIARYIDWIRTPGRRQRLLCRDRSRSPREGHRAERRNNLTVRRHSYLCRKTRIGMTSNLFMPDFTVGSPSAIACASA